jgi:hypothetical protein
LVRGGELEQWNVKGGSMQFGEIVFDRTRHRGRFDQHNERIISSRRQWLLPSRNGYRQVE